MTYPKREMERVVRYARVLGIDITSIDAEHSYGPERVYHVYLRHEGRAGVVRIANIPCHPAETDAGPYVADLYRPKDARIDRVGTTAPATVAIDPMGTWAGIAPATTRSVIESSRQRSTRASESRSVYLRRIARDLARDVFARPGEADAFLGEYAAREPSLPRDAMVSRAAAILMDDHDQEMIATIPYSPFFGRAVLSLWAKRFGRGLQSQVEAADTPALSDKQGLVHRSLAELPLVLRLHQDIVLDHWRDGVPMTEHEQMIWHLTDHMPVQAQTRVTIAGMAVWRSHGERAVADPWFAVTAAQRALYLLREGYYPRAGALAAYGIPDIIIEPYESADAVRADIRAAASADGTMEIPLPRPRWLDPEETP